MNEDDGVSRIAYGFHIYRIAIRGLDNFDYGSVGHDF